MANADMAAGAGQRIVAAPQALKGSLDAAEVGAAIAAGVRDVLPAAEVVVVPVADGGEGTVRALVAATGGELRRATVTGPTGDPVEAEYGLLGAAPGEERAAVIEMAAASGLPLVPLERRNPLVTTTRGTGELMRAALDAGARRLLIGIGGSATNDGGAGMAQALGAHLLDAAGRELPPGGAALAELAHIDVSGLDARLQAAEVRVACDVNNPLCGPRGASAVYGPQKGATPAMVAQLDAALAHYVAVLRRDLGADVAGVPGAGAAGGLGAGMMAFAHAELVPGARLVLDALHFAERVAGAALVITAEGQLDEQTAYGKAPAAVAAAAKQAGAAVVALAGSVVSPPDALDALGIDAAVPLPTGPMSLDESMARAAELVRMAAARALRLMLLGRKLAASE
ncbi:MAG TPA: glycerate kinase [Ktedonobacterales bacterium]|nr:glycerate kinase [Ktedonobacterales bacterium]